MLSNSSFRKICQASWVLQDQDKTTIAKTVFKHLPHVSLENIDIRFQAQNDPRAFLANYQQGAIFDEVH